MPLLVVGTPVPPEVTSVLTDYPRAEITGVRWTAPAQWLVTLREVGDVSSETADAIATALRAALGGLTATEAALGEVRRDGGIMIDVGGLDAHTVAVFAATTSIVSVPSSVDRRAEIVVARGRVGKELLRPVPPIRWRVGELVLATASRSKDAPALDVVESFPLA